MLPMIPERWAEEKALLRSFLSRDFIAPHLGVVYQWHADRNLCVRNADQRPFLLAWPQSIIKKPNPRLPVVDNCIGFTAEDLKGVTPL